MSDLEKRTAGRYRVQRARAEDEFDEHGEWRNEVYDTVTGEQIGTDGGEPEDQTLTRDWKWVPIALSKAFSLGRAEGRADVGKYSNAIGRIESVLGITGAVRMDETVAAVERAVRDLRDLRLQRDAAREALARIADDDCDEVNTPRKVARAALAAQPEQGE